ncbi:ATP-binding protein [Nocardioides gilvus]|uniref:ATP-binding protein n=1 Tax=Nocardioides gilvus TaxID=1735589 RepID=UPI000D74EC4A|nr:ATP-binding protein [Nocardioides gilvus]
MSGALRAVLLLLAASLLGALTHGQTSEEAAGLGLYPLGLLAVALLQVHGTARRWFGIAAVVTTSASLWILGVSFPLSLAFAVAGILSAGLALRILRATSGPLRMRTESDLVRVVVAAVLGGVIVAVIAGVVGLLTGVEEPTALLVSSFINQTASLVLWLPLVMRHHEYTVLAGLPERIVQWCLLVGFTMLIFSTTSTPEFAYVVLAILGWAGLRLSLIETLVQLIVVRLITTIFTARDSGPFAFSTHGRDLPPDLETLYVQVFLITCSVTVVALSLSAARTRADGEREAYATADKVAENKLNTVFEELEAERHALEEMREVDRVKDAFVSTVSHELRTPITNIIGYTEMLEDGDFGGLSPDQSEATIRIGDNGRRLLSLIDDLLDLSRLRSAEMEIMRTPLDLVPVVRAAEQAILPRLRPAQVSLEMDLPTYQVVVQGEAEKLERVLLNLMSNAVKFTPPLGRVTVRLAREGAWAIIEVADTGYGIGEEDLDRLFSQFFRSKVAAERHIQGTGLGLSIVRSIVEAHGGQVEVASTLDVGTTFRVYLPC